MSQRLLALVVLFVHAVTLAGCAGDHEGETAGASANGLPAWEIAAEPLLAVGDRDGTDTLVFAGVTDVRWHPSGVLVVADGGAFGIRVFDEQGALTASGGRRGRGPREFTGSLSLDDAAGDSVAVWDAGQGRWTMFSVADGGMRAVPGPLRYPAWMHAGIMVQSALDVPPAWVPPLLTRLSAESADVRYARIDALGFLYVSQDAGHRRWLVYRDSTDAVASLTLPDGFTLTQVAADALAGITSDSVGLQQATVYALTRGGHEAPDLTPAAPAVVDAESRAQLMAGLRNAVTAQELGYMTRNSYTTVADSLEVPMPPGAQFKVLEATARGWRGVAWFPASGFTCGMIIGMTTPAGWSEGEVNCGWQRAPR